jgi:SAM-dependent methyltransferase
MSSISRQQLEQWVKEIKDVKGRVLDVGGSQSPVIKRLQNTELVDKCDILDLAEPHHGNAPELAHDLNYPFPADHNNIFRTVEKYDIAFCLEVAEYWWNPYQALKNINYLLKPGGSLYISFHFIYSVHNPKGLDYLRYTSDGCEKLLNEAGFKVDEHKYRIGQGFQTAYEINRMRGRKDYNQNIQGSLIKTTRIG